jgi:hypothetical protein
MTDLKFKWVLPPANGAAALRDALYHEGKYYAFGGSSGMFMMEQCTGDPHVQGNWVNLQVPPFEIRTVHGGGGLIVAGGVFKQILIFDGTQWKTIPLPERAGQAWAGSCYFQGKHFLAGTGGESIVSADGKTWQPGPQFSREVKDLCVTSTGVLVAELNGAVGFVDNSWKVYEMPLASAVNFNSVGYNPATGTYFVGGGASKIDELWYTKTPTNGPSWTKLPGAYPCIMEITSAGKYVALCGNQEEDKPGILLLNCETMVLEWPKIGTSINGVQVASFYSLAINPVDGKGIAIGGREEILGFTVPVDVTTPPPNDLWELKLRNAQDKHIYTIALPKAIMDVVVSAVTYKPNWIKQTVTKV